MAYSDTIHPWVESIDIELIWSDEENGERLLEISGHFKDNLSGIAIAHGSLVIEWRSPSGVGYGTHLHQLNSGNNLDGIYKGTIPLPQNAESGMWTLQRLEFRDNVGNSVGHNRQSLQDLGIQTDFVVNNKLSDGIKPLVESIDIELIWSDEENGERLLEISGHFKDNLSGIAIAHGSLVIEWRSPSGVGYGTHLHQLDSGNNLDGIYKGTIPLPKNAESGTWTLQRLEFRDNVGNSVGHNRQSLQDLGIQTDFVVNNKLSDGIKPLVESIDIELIWSDEENGERLLEISGHFKDNLSGIAIAHGSLVIEWRSPSGVGYGTHLHQLDSGNNLDGIYKGTIPLPKNAESGTWTLQRLEFRDNVGNSVGHNRQSLQDLGIQTDFSVQEWNKLKIRGNSLYTVVEGPSWSHAEANSVKLGGHLATLNSESEQKWIIDNTKPAGPGLWIGYSDSEQEGKWNWSSGETTTYTNWGYPNEGSGIRYEPNGGTSENFAHIWGQYNWHDHEQGTWNDLPDLSAENYYHTLIGLSETHFIRRGDSAYVIVEGPSWEEAEANAVKLGGHLVTINDAAENEWLHYTFGINLGRHPSVESGWSSYYIGYTDKNSEGAWAWASNEKSAYQNWYPGEPNGGSTENYAHLGWSGSGYWNDTRNATDFQRNDKGITEIKLAPNNQPTGTPSVTGTLKAGSTLTIDASTIKDADNFTGYTPTFQYSWEISGDGTTWSKLTTTDATDNNTTYNLTSADAGKQIRGVVAYLDGYGTNEKVLSSPSNKIQENTELFSLDLERWALIAHISSEGGMFDGNGDLKQDYSYGTYVSKPEPTTSDFQREFKVEPGTKILFVTGDSTTWATTDYSALRSIIDSRNSNFSENISFSVYKGGKFETLGGNILARNGALEDPWITFSGGHFEGIASESIIWGEQDYFGRNGGGGDFDYPGAHSLLKNNHQGINVYITRSANSAPIGNPTISGSLKVGSTLTIDASAIKDDDNFTGYNPSYLYSWETSTDATTWSKLTSTDATDNNTTYTLTAAEVDNHFRGVVNYVDGYGTSENVASKGSLVESTIARTQQIKATQDEYNYRPGTTISVPLQYTTSTGDANLSGLTLNVHYNSSILSPTVGNNGVSGQVESAITSNKILPDTNDLDKDPLTDKIVQLIWASFDNTFPNRSLPDTVATVNFTTANTKVDPLTGKPTSTTLRYTSSATATDYDFLSGSTNLKANIFNLDIDGDGKVTALGDGLMIIRKLLGSAFDGEALTAKARSSKATRSTAEIHSFIQSAIDLGTLDIDKNGQTTALGDGLMIIRRLLGPAFDGEALTYKALSATSPYYGKSEAPSIVANNIDTLLIL